MKKVWWLLFKWRIYLTFQPLEKKKNEKSYRSFNIDLKMENYEPWKTTFILDRYYYTDFCFKKVVIHYGGSSSKNYTGNWKGKIVIQRKRKRGKSRGKWQKNRLKKSKQNLVFEKEMLVLTTVSSLCSLGENMRIIFTLELLKYLIWVLVCATHPNQTFPQISSLFSLKDS